MESVVGIASGLHDRLRAIAAASLGREICGLLFGTAASIDDAILCDNIADDPFTTFEIDPTALIAAHRAMRDGGARLIGHFHSHPNGRAEPSTRDADAAGGDGMLWLIIASDTLRLWRAVDGGAWLASFDPVSLHVAAPCAAPRASP